MCNLIQGFALGAFSFLGKRDQLRNIQHNRQNADIICIRRDGDGSPTLVNGLDAIAIFS